MGRYIENGGFADDQIFGHINNALSFAPCMEYLSHESKTKLNLTL